MWIANLEKDVLADMVRWHPCAGFMLDTDGKIVGANKAFQTWSGYSLAQLQHIDVQRIHILPDSSQDDLLTQCRRLTRTDPNTLIRTQFRANGEAPEWGKLRILRTATADDSVVYFWCVWEPVCDDTREAFAATTKLIAENTAAMIEMRQEFKAGMSRTDAENWVVSTIRLMEQYPKTIMAIVAFFLSAFGVTNLVDTAQKLGLLPSEPIVVEPKQVIFQQPAERQAATGIAAEGLRKSDMIIEQAPITVHYRRPKHPIEEIKWHPTPVWKNATQ